MVRLEDDGSDRSRLGAATVEMTLVPTTDGTLVRVQFSELPAELAVEYSRLWKDYLDRIAAVVSGSHR